MLKELPLEEQAKWARRFILTMIYQAGSGHPGGSLSCVDLLLCIYEKAKVKDKIVLSKGHAAPALYAAMAIQGIIPISELSTFRKIHGRLQGHPSAADLPETHASTGSLGQGFSSAIGMALGARHQKVDHHIYTILGDGECQEGMVWEGALFADQWKLNNLTAILDYNKLQSDSRNDQVLGLEPLMQKWESFNWNVLEIDGHHFGEIKRALDSESDKPKLILAHTVKGKGVSYMENDPPWHGSVTLADDQLILALSDCGLPAKNIQRWLSPQIFEELEKQL